MRRSGRKDRPEVPVYPDSWRPGTQLFHEEYGIGVVQKCLANGGHTTIHVLFESGKRATLLPEFAAHKMEVLDMFGPLSPEEAARIARLPVVNRARGSRL